MAELRVPMVVYQALTGLPAMLANVQRNLAIPSPIKSVTLDGNFVLVGFDAEGFGPDEEVDILLTAGVGKVAPLAPAPTPDAPADVGNGQPC